MTVTVGDLLVRARRQLARAPFQPSTREANLLLGSVLGADEATLLAHPERRVEEHLSARFLDLLDRRLRGEPVAYLLGVREFYGRAFVVDPRVLIPRPETEHLVEACRELELPRHARILDLGTGSGCLAITLAMEIPTATVTAADVSLDALAVAARNVATYQLCDRIQLVAADLAAGIRADDFHAAAANLPYIDPSDSAVLSPEVRDYEPPIALFAAGHGLELIAAALRQLTRLRTGSPVLLEIGAGQLAGVETLATRLGYRLLDTRFDYAGKPRVVILERR